jgi:hypothetical protein
MSPGAGSNWINSKTTASLTGSTKLASSGRPADEAVVPSAQPDLGALVAQATELERDSLVAAQGTTVDATPETEADATAELPLEARLSDAVRGASAAKKAYDRVKEDLAGRELALSKEKEQLARLRDELCVREESLSAWHAELSEKLRRVEADRIDLAKREADAREGFPQQLQIYRETIETPLIARERALEERSAKVNEREEQLRAKERALESEQKALQRAREELEDERGDVRERIEIAQQRATASVENRVMQLEGDLEDARRRVADSEERLRSRGAEIAMLQRRLAPTGGQSLEQMQSSCDELKTQLEELQRELIGRPAATEVAELRRRAGSLDGLSRDLEQARADNAALRARLTGLSVGSNELEGQRDLVKSLETRVSLLKEANSQLDRDVKSQLGAVNAQSPFSQLARFDADEKLQRPPGRGRIPASLKDLVTELRTQLASLKPALHYHDATLRCFLGGMAMSRLHLLQGISGTGKTSLPRAVAAVLGGLVEVVPVQAGWRDRQDLLGYFNAFDKRYHEPAFVQTLYRSLCPEWSDRVCFVVLDEMNLSYVEQFGADLLSALEQPEDQRRFELMSEQPPSPPKLLREGRYLSIPPNVWFVGTANHDETTKDFADKTYDRAHTMELPRHHRSSSEDKPVAQQPPISFAGLRSLFEGARDMHKGETQKALKSLQTLEPQLRAALGVGWGNRLDSQIERFVPVVVAAQGTAGEAFDHILATKLLRKVRGKHEVRTKSLTQFRDALKDAWQKDFGKTEEPTKSLELLKELIEARAADAGVAT